MFKIYIFLLFFDISLRKYFKPALADGLSLESERQQVSLGLQDTSHYSSQPQQCCRLDSLRSSSDFQFFQIIIIITTIIIIQK